MLYFLLSENLISGLTAKGEKMKQALMTVLALCSGVCFASPDVHIGVGVWIWRLQICENGDIGEIVARAEKARLGHVLIRVSSNGDRWASFNNRSQVIELASRLRKKEIKVFAWGYHFPYKIESQVAFIQAVLSMPEFDGYVLNVEEEFQNCSKRAMELLAPIRRFRDSEYPKKLLGYSTFARIDRGVGKKMPLEVLGRYCDVAMPQAYWKDFGWDPQVTAYRICQIWLAQEKQWQAEGKTESIKPLIPTAQAYDGREGTVKIPAEELKAFLGATEGYFGVNVWRWGRMDPGHWRVLKEYGEHQKVSPVIVILGLMAVLVVVIWEVLKRYIS